MRTQENIQAQITALEIKMSKCKVDGKPTKEWFSINGKINQLKKLLQNKKVNDWLAK